MTQNDIVNFYAPPPDFFAVRMTILLLQLIRLVLTLIITSRQHLPISFLTFFL